MVSALLDEAEGYANETDEGYSSELNRARGRLLGHLERMLQMREALYYYGYDDDVSDEGNNDDVVAGDDDGPLPMDTREINNIKTTMIDQKMVDETSKCPICLDVFKI